MNDTHAFWVHIISEKFACSACCRISTVDTLWGEPAYDYCPYCAAKMDAAVGFMERKTNGET